MDQEWNNVEEAAACPADHVPLGGNRVSRLQATAQEYIPLSRKERWLAMEAANADQQIRKCFARYQYIMGSEIETPAIQFGTVPPLIDCQFGSFDVSFPRVYGPPAASENVSFIDTPTVSKSSDGGQMPPLLPQPFCNVVQHSNGPAASENVSYIDTPTVSNSSEGGQMPPLLPQPFCNVVQHSNGFFPSNQMPPQHFGSVPQYPVVANPMSQPQLGSGFEFSDTPYPCNLMPPFSQESNLYLPSDHMPPPAPAPHEHMNNFQAQHFLPPQHYQNPPPQLFLPPQHPQHYENRPPQHFLPPQHYQNPAPQHIRPMYTPITTFQGNNFSPNWPDTA